MTFRDARKQWFDTSVEGVGLYSIGWKLVILCWANTVEPAIPVHSSGRNRRNSCRRQFQYRWLHRFPFLPLDFRFYHPKILNIFCDYFPNWIWFSNRKTKSWFKKAIPSSPRPVNTYIYIYIYYCCVSMCVHSTSLCWLGTPLNTTIGATSSSTRHIEFVVQFMWSCSTAPYFLILGPREEQLRPTALPSLFNHIDWLLPRRRVRINELSPVSSFSSACVLRSAVCAIFFLAAD